MSDQQQNFNADDVINKAKDYAKDNPEQARGAIDKLEQAINEKTGGQYKDVIEKGGEYLEKAFGIPSDVSNNPPEPAPEEGSDPGTPTPEPQQAPRTEQPADPAPDEQPAPADSDAAPPSTPDDTATTPDDGTSPKTLPPFGN